MVLKPKPASFMSVTIFLLLISASVNVLQARRIQSLVASGTAVGRTAPTLHGIDPSGADVSFETQGSTPTVVYYFSQACTWCEQNWSNVRELANSRGEKFRFVAVSDLPVRPEFLRKRDLRFDVVTGISQSTKAVLGFRGTPHTIVVSSEGIITHDWPGAYAGRLRARLEDLFHVTLPGLDADASLPKAR